MWVCDWGWSNYRGQELPSEEGILELISKNAFDSVRNLPSRYNGTDRPTKADNQTGRTYIPELLEELIQTGSGAGVWVACCSSRWTAPSASARAGPHWGEGVWAVSSVVFRCITGDAVPLPSPGLRSRGCCKTPVQPGSTSSHPHPCRVWGLESNPWCDQNWLL